MPRGKRTVFAVFCPTSGNRLGSMRLLRQDKKGRGYKEHVKDMRKYCPKCKARVAVKLKEERHSK